MFVRISTLLVLGALAAGCAHEPAKTAHTPAPAPFASRWVANAGVNILADKYADIMVIYCAANKGVIYIDPNRCNEAKAHGSDGCTELALQMYAFTVTQSGGATILKSERVSHKMEQKSDGFVVHGLDWRNKNSKTHLSVYQEGDKDRIAELYCRMAYR